MFENQPLGFCETNRVDNRGMIELVGDDRIFIGKKGLEEADVGHEAGRIEHRVLGADKIGNRTLQVLVNRLRAADKSHGSEPKPPFFYRSLRGFFHLLRPG